MILLTLWAAELVGCLVLGAAVGGVIGVATAVIKSYDT